MKYCGEICRGCKAECFEPPTEQTPLDLQCHICEGTGCEACNKTGYHPIKQCPSEMMGTSFVGLINLAIHAMKGHLPEDGGLLDQDAHFIHTWQAFQSDVELIQAMQRAKRTQKRGR